MIRSPVSVANMDCARNGRGIVCPSGPSIDSPSSSLVLDNDVVSEDASPRTSKTRSVVGLPNTHSIFRLGPSVLEWALKLAQQSCGLLCVQFREGDSFEEGLGGRSKDASVSPAMRCTTTLRLADGPTWIDAVSSPASGRIGSSSPPNLVTDDTIRC